MTPLEVFEFICQEFYGNNRKQVIVSEEEYNPSLTHPYQGSLEEIAEGNFVHFADVWTTEQQILENSDIESIDDITDEMRSSLPMITSINYAFMVKKLGDGINTPLHVELNNPYNILFEDELEKHNIHLPLLTVSEW